MHKTRAAVWLAPIILFFFIAIIAPPLVLQTKSYPLTVVEGDSMLPNLHQGDLVIYRGLLQGQMVQNGSIIIYITSKTGSPILDQMTKPVIIHRVVNIVVQRDGVYYQTKGDNNPSPDASLVRSDKILGIQLGVIPKAGTIILFLKSPQGLVAALAILLTTNQSMSSRRLQHSIGGGWSRSDTGTKPRQNRVRCCVCESCLNEYP